MTTRYPSLWNADAVVKHGQHNAVGLTDGRYVAARPEGFWYNPISGLQHRFKLAWLVFTGRCDALEWTGQP